MTRRLLALLVCVSALTISLSAAVLNFCGWETGDASEASSSSGTFSIQTTTVRTGTYALRANPTTTAIGYHELQKTAADGSTTGFNLATAFHRFYFRYATKPAATDEPFAACTTAATAMKAEIRLNSAGNIAAYDSVPTLLATGTATLNAGTWYRIELKCGTNATTGAVEVKVNGTVDISTAGNTTITNNGGILLGKTANRNGQTVDFFYDDYQTDDAVYPGVGKVLAQLPISDGTYVDWTIGAGASRWAAISERPHDSSTSYVVSTLNTVHAITANVQNHTAAGITGTVSAVKALVNWARDGATNGSAKVRVRSNTTDSDTTAASSQAAYLARARVYTTDPATSVAWTLSGLDTLQVGAVEASATNKTRLTNGMVLVSFDDSSAASPCSSLSLLGVGCSP